MEKFPPTKGHRAIEYVPLDGTPDPVRLEAQVWVDCMTMLAEAGEETLPAVADLAAGVTRSPAPDGDGASADGGSGERRRWSLMQGVGSRRLHLVRLRADLPLPGVPGAGLPQRIQMCEGANAGRVLLFDRIMLECMS